MATPLQPDVVVNGEVIAARDIAAEAQNHVAPPGKPGFAWQAAARALAVRALLLQEAARLGLTPEPRDLGHARRETREEALIRAVIEARIEGRTPNDAACRVVYAAHPDSFRAPTLYEAAHILLPAAPEDAPVRAAAAATAAVLLAELARAPDRFDQLARAHSACPSRDSGGRLGQIITGDTVPEFEAALDALDPGQTAAAPVVTRYGLHILRLDARAVGQVLPFDKVIPRIRETLEKRAWAIAAKHLVADLVARSEIEGVTFERAA